MGTYRLAWLVIATVVFGLLSSGASEAAPPKPDVPDELADWVKWVEETEPEPRDCRKVEGDVTICVWPSYLELDVGSDGAKFSLDVSVFGPVEVELPGDAEQWPQDVKIDGKVSAVLREGEGPQVDLEEGRHTVTGFIPWREAPDSLRVPQSIGLINLRVAGTAIPFPSRTEATLSLEGPDAEVEPELPEEELDPPAEPVPNSETMEVSRRLTDWVPLRVTTRIDVHVAGEARELVLPNPTLEGGKLLQVSSPVPVSMGDGGALVLQVRPGTFSVELEAVLPRSPEGLTPPSHPAPWPDNEIWVWKAAGGGRSVGQVSLSGAQAVDHARTHAPSDWQGGATYRLDAGATLQFEVIQRGVSETSTNELALRREMRVDLDGAGWTVVDEITGEMNTASRIDLHADQGVLGSVASGGQAQVVTVSDEGNAGVEVRGSALNMRAVWRIEGATSTLPLGGWSEDFDQVELMFSLPRGWDLLHAEGPGSPEPTWLGAWRPLDLIALLGVVILVGRLVSLGAGGAALVGLGLAYTRNGDGYLMLLGLVALLAALLVPLRRPQSKPVELTLRGAWGLAAFVVTAWVIWKMPAGVAAVWRDGLSGLAHVHLERELESVATVGMVLAVVSGGVVGVAVLGARARKNLVRVVAVGFVGAVGLLFAFMTLGGSADESMGASKAPASAVDFGRVGAEQAQLAAAPEPEPETEEEMDADDAEASLRLAADVSANEDEDVWGGLTGSEVGEAYGVGGLGLVGTGRGGGGTGEGTIGLGNTGLIGKGGGGGTGSGYGRGAGAGLGGRSKRVPRVRQGKAEVSGGLDKDIVRRIVRSHINEVRHCYNQGLSRAPGLSGRVSLSFSVTPSGTVSSAVVQESTLSDNAVGACMSKAVKRWKFPKPQGGAAVSVTYPFTLSAGDGAAAGEAVERFVAKDVALPEIEPPAVPQTGEGVPVWSGPSWTMTINRTVKRDESVTLWLVSPTASRVVSVVRALALMLLTFFLLQAGWFVRPATGPVVSATVARAASVGIVGIVLLAGRAASAAPPAELLEQLAERVNAERPLAPSPDCGTNCALVNKLEVGIAGDDLTLRAEVHMAGPGVWTLPGPLETWSPRSAKVDGKPARAIAVHEGQLLLHMGSGLHVVTLEGPVGADALDLDLAGSPKHVVVSTDGWTADGVDEDDLAQSLHFEREATGEVASVETEGEEPELDPSEAEPERKSRDMDPWFALERRIQIGPRWTVQTTVTRLNHGPSPTKLHVPLLPGESMLEATGKVDDPKATVTLRAPGESIGWSSVLEPSAALELSAPKDATWTETWVVTCAGAWQCSDEGTPATTDSGGERVFHPWPGETLRLSFFEPRPADGQLLAVDEANLVLDVSETGTDARLTMTVRTATVGERTITLPSEAHVGSVKIGGTDVPTAKDATGLRLTFQPGLHQVEVEFQLDAGGASVLRAPVVDLGGRAVNARVSFEDAGSSDRVVVWTSGEGMGPMVWLWPYLGVLALLAIVLARFTRPPLNALQWFLLSLGFSVLTLPIVWGWFVLVQWRKQQGTRLHDAVRYNLVQIGLGLLTLAVVGIVVMTGIDLLRAPASTIVHSWSDGSQLSWYQDRVATTTPQAVVVTVPNSLWRAVWAAWVVWLGWSSIAWSKWVYGVASDGGWLRSQAEPSDTEAQEAPREAVATDVVSPPSAEPSEQDSSQD